MRPSRKDELIDKALEIFYRDGFHATGMDKLVHETGISKTSMYKYFATKEDLILATLERRHEQFTALLTEGPAARADTPKGQLMASFDTLQEWIASDGFNSCMFIKASSEFQDPSHPIHQMAATHKRALTEHMANLARKAGAKEPEALARQLMLLKEGAIVTAHIQGKAFAAPDAKDAARTLINLACP
ncbi:MULTISPECIES: TetR/AcrR family transcriptional regulator [Kordiimonas]|jgi:AcrR family transcriptional regulator|uniref:TetR/AcrR family transcriptional regulator n=1 Tax=Kordiimonas TaxID=288021 RepID=UPI00257CAE87|nr:TetR family transcriptional regulator [Kordiimonas sp. UBA4487]